jgi:DNA modification methylase
MAELIIVKRKVSNLLPYARNARTHSDTQIEQIAQSIQEFGFNNPVLIDENDGIIAGHGRVLAAYLLNWDEVPCIPLSHLSERQRRAYRIADNQIALNSGWDFDKLSSEISYLLTSDFDISLIGFDEQWIDALLKNDESIVSVDKGRPGKISRTPKNFGSSDHSGVLFDKFIYPPFSVLNTNSGEWRERKKYWREKIGDLGESREGAIGNSDLMLSIGKGVSILDPVLAELVVRWFCIPGGKTFDPFAGDTVFGFVSAYVGSPFTGIELRREQVELNQSRVNAGLLNAKYICDDAVNIGSYIENDSHDMLFSCPPYFDLEKYSTDPRDVSNKSYKEFISTLKNVFTQAYNQLRNNRFAVLVLSDVRDEKGIYRGLVQDVQRVMCGIGFHFYNDMILLNTAGTLPLRIGRQFNAGRKIGRIHQNILVFYKGRPGKINETFGDVIAPEEMEGDE